MKTLRTNAHRKGHASQKKPFELGGSSDLLLQMALVRRYHGLKNEGEAVKTDKSRSRAKGKLRKEYPGVRIG